MNVSKIILKLFSHCLLISNFQMLNALTIQQDHGIFFKFLNKKELVLKTFFSGLHFKSYSSDKNGCVSYCLSYASCKSANFRISTGECSLFEANSWEIEFDIVSENDTNIIQKIAESTVNHGEWTLVLRGLANINKPVYDTYKKKSLYHDQPLSPMYPLGCLRLDTNLSCDHHFRSKLLNQWPRLAQTELQVKFEIYNDGVMEKFLLFNGTNTTVIDWFSLNNLINSSWTDLNSTNVKAFEIDGYGNRSFYIKYHSQDCNKDIGLLACVDSYDDLCAWGKPVPTFPRFLYSPGTTGYNYINMSRADLIAIFIKY